MKNVSFHPPIHPGKEVIHGGATHKLQIDRREGQFAHHGVTHLAMCEGGFTLIRFGDTMYNNFAYTETKTNSSTIAASAGGVRFQTAAGGTVADGDNTEIVSIRTFKPVAGPDPMSKNIYIASARLQVSSAANFGFSFGFVTAAATGVVAAAPNDGIYFVKAKNSANIVGKTVQGGGALHASGTLLALADATDVVLTVKIFVGDTAAHTTGEFWVNGVRTAFTAAQNADVWALIATALSAQLGFAVNGAVQRSATVAWVVAEGDR